MNNYTRYILKDLIENKLLVAGCGGYIGTELVNQLELNNIEYVGIDKTQNKNCLCINLCDKGKVEDLISSLEPDYLFHMGTHSALAYKNDFLESFNEDMDALYNIFSCIRNRNNIKLIYFSSSYVYSGLNIYNSVNENTLLAPTHNFGLAKSFFEQMILRVHPNSIIFRLSSVFGQGNYLHPNAIEVMAQEAMNDKFLTIWGKGMRKMQYVFLEDVVKYILKGTKLLPGIYNLAGNNYETVDATATYIADYFGTITKKLPEKNEGETLPFMDNDKLINALGHENFSNHRISLTQYLSDISN
jgi:nucleoside-diphosphate-sugar epimerase